MAPATRTVFNHLRHRFRMSDGPSDEAILRATGKEPQAWYRILDGYGKEVDHTARTRRLSEEHPDLPGWWCQAVVVAYERARGLRVHGQSCRGDFQLSCSRTLPVPAEEAWRRVLAVLPASKGTNGAWEEGATWRGDEGQVEVRRVDPGKMLRWFWTDDSGRSIVEVAFDPKPGRCTVTFSQRGLPTKGDADAHRARWRATLDAIAG